MTLVMYVDETGDHSMTTIDPEYPVFALAACIFNQPGYTRFEADLGAFKIAHLGDPGVILHSASISRARGDFRQLTDPDRRARFNAGLIQLIAGTEVTIVCAVVHKQRHAAVAQSVVHPYHYCLEVVLERFALELRDRHDAGSMIFESRNTFLDRQLRSEFARCLAFGTPNLQPQLLRRHVEGITFATKRQNVAGLQLADLAASPMARSVIGRTARPDFDAFWGKLRRDPRTGEAIGNGLVVLPGE